MKMDSPRHQPMPPRSPAKLDDAGQQDQAGPYETMKREIDRRQAGAHAMEGRDESPPPSSARRRCRRRCRRSSASATRVLACRIHAVVCSSRTDSNGASIVQTTPARSNSIFTWPEKFRRQAALDQARTKYLIGLAAAPAGRRAPPT